MPIAVVFRCEICGRRPGPEAQVALERQLLDLRHGEYVDAEPERWLSWHGRGIYGPARYACGEHRGELKALLREQYGTLGWHPWAKGPHPWAGRRGTDRARRLRRTARSGIWICAAVSLMLCAAAESAWASFPGRNGKIAYLWIGESAYRAGPTATSIRTVDPRTGVVRVLRDCPLRADAPSTYTECSVRAPSYAPDGSRLAFAVTHTAPGAPGEALRVEPGLATMTANGGSLEEHVTEHDYLAVSWSPAGARFLLDRFPHGSGADNAVFLATLDGTELSQVVLGQGADWSSRGEIAFGRYRAQECLPMCENIFITRLGGTPRRLTHRGGSSPSWSPHGSKLAFVRRDNVYIVRRDGRGLHRVTRRGGSNPAWSPDGRWIAFIRNGDVFVIRPNGEDRRRLVHGAVTALGEGPQVQSIDWQPIPRH